MGERFFDELALFHFMERKGSDGCAGRFAASGVGEMRVQNGGEAR